MPTGNKEKIFLIKKRFLVFIIFFPQKNFYFYFPVIQEKENTFFSQTCFGFYYFFSPKFFLFFFFRWSGKKKTCFFLKWSEWVICNLITGKKKNTGVLLWMKKFLKWKNLKENFCFTHNWPKSGGYQKKQIPYQWALLII